MPARSIRRLETSSTCCTSTPTALPAAGRAGTSSRSAAAQPCCAASSHDRPTSNSSCATATGEPLSQARPRAPNCMAQRGGYVLPELGSDKQICGRLLAGHLCGPLGKLHKLARPCSGRVIGPGLAASCKVNPPSPSSCLSWTVELTLWLLAGEPCF